MIEDPPNEAMGFVRACRHYFSAGKYGKEIEVEELTSLKYEDKMALYEMLTGIGYNVSPPIPPPGR